MDQMSELKLKTNILQGLIEADKSTSKTREDKLSLLIKQMLTSKIREENISLLREQLLVALSTAYQDLKRTNSTTIQRYTAMRIQYIVLQDEYVTLAEYTTGE